MAKSRTFDQDLYNRVLDSEECEKQMIFLKSNDTRLYGRFLDTGMRTPRSLSKMNSVDLGDYHACLEIVETRVDMNIQGNPKGFAVGNRNNLIRSEAGDATSQGSLSVAICIPKVCTSQEFTNRHFNLSAVGFKFEEQFCRLPNDKPWVPVDYVAIAIFSFIALLTLLGTLYDVIHTFVLKTDKNSTNIYIHGVRSLSMLWIILGHSYSMPNFNLNLIDGLQWVNSVSAVWIFTALSAVDTFFFMAGVLLVYTSVGKMSGTKFLKNLHVFYLNRLLRMFPLLAALILLEASVFHRMVDGPYWVAVARNAERCRTYWWTTLLHVQNYVNPSDLCIGHSWYIAIDIQLHIVSPLVLFWIIGNNKKAAWSALITAFLTIFVACTLWNALREMPGGSTMQPARGNQDWIRQRTSVMRVIWSIGLGWIIFACAKGYGGPINWFLSLSLWKIPARISYAMYLYHYPIMSVVAGMQLSPQYFSPGAKIYDFMAITVISLWVSYAVTVVIDAPFSSIIKMVLGGGQSKRRMSTEKVADSSNLGTSTRNVGTLLESYTNRRRPILENNHLGVQKNKHVNINKDQGRNLS
ncbi:jg5352 [Pararge aegeria aegeria]|uniref:Jg5352 protein n=1 Tax=Pararge aegeria aegeria TaxID=348720 RepID=A0A8S4R7M8_9NEOP|nr:jg5352 [Pararge aegeria aegeria]